MPLGFDALVALSQLKDAILAKLDQRSAEWKKNTTIPEIAPEGMPSPIDMYGGPGLAMGSLAKYRIPMHVKLYENPYVRNRSVEDFLYTFRNRADQPPFRVEANMALKPQTKEAHISYLKAMGEKPATYTESMNLADKGHAGIDPRVFKEVVGRLVEDLSGAGYTKFTSEPISPARGRLFDRVMRQLKKEGKLPEGLQYEQEVNEYGRPGRAQDIIRSRRNEEGLRNNPYYNREVRDHSPQRPNYISEWGQDVSGWESQLARDAAWVEEQRRLMAEETITTDRPLGWFEEVVAENRRRQPSILSPDDAEANAAMRRIQANLNNLQFEDVQTSNYPSATEALNSIQRAMTPAEMRRGGPTLQEVNNILVAHGERERPNLIEANSTLHQLLQRLNAEEQAMRQVTPPTRTPYSHSPQRAAYLEQRFNAAREAGDLGEADMLARNLRNEFGLDVSLTPQEQVLLRLEEARSTYGGQDFLNRTDPQGRVIPRSPEFQQYLQHLENDPTSRSPQMQNIYDRTREANRYYRLSAEDLKDVFSQHIARDEGSYLNPRPVPPTIEELRANYPGISSLTD